MSDGRKLEYAHGTPQKDASHSTKKITSTKVHFLELLAIMN
ncbi:hypothetical protein BVRB_5g117970 [Beta vulgaris subsp. vulgaris]|nr:hypothetical protein BVRB_5g117970 [Beta vulgaris subsp. vulgaris]